ncbi:MAG TPA: helix-turn-helix domain-containing protein [Conexibacter sp.]|jgi:hypothetical protein|nr:helix-turn-helix domain-containing protein [Conexibacter sp.]
MAVTARQLIDAFIDQITASVDEILDETNRLMGEAVPTMDITAHPELAATAEASSRASLDLLMDAFRNRAVPAAVPPEGIAETRMCARLGIPVSDLLDTYRIAHHQVWRLAIDVVERASPVPEVRAEALRVIAHSLYGYLGLASAVLPEVYASARSTRTHRLLASVRRVLEGVSSELEETGYDLRANHVGLVAWGADAGVMIDALTAAGGLAVMVEDETVWGWIAAGSGPDDIPVAAARLAIGEPARGLGGFRRTHIDAIRGQAVAARTGAPVTRYRDVALEWLALSDLGGARAFVDAELGLLAGGGARGARLRETVAAYLVAGQSRAAAAAALGVADRTVAYRLRTAEERLGRPVYTRSTELAIALRWATFLGPNLPESAT